MARSPIQPKKQENKKGSGDGGWRRRRRGEWTKFEKRGVGNTGES